MTFDQDFKEKVNEKIKEIWPNHLNMTAIEISRLNEFGLWAYDMGKEG